MRLFIALNLSAELRSRIAAEVLSPLKEQVPGVRWVRQETLHVTLLFLGERGAAGLQKARAVVQEVAAAHKAFTLSLTGLGVFPFPGWARPRVVWLGLTDPAPMDELHRALVREHGRLDLSPEGRAYTPHVTLGRVPPRAEANARRVLPPALATVRFEAPVAFTSVDLMQSELTPRGPRYRALLAAPLTRSEVR